MVKTKWIVVSESGKETEYDDFSMAFWGGMELYGEGNFIIRKEDGTDI